MRSSIIIAAHQEGALLGKTIEACLRGCSDLEHEIIVADDASTDGSVDEVGARFPQVRIVRHEKRRGVSPTKDLGARRATGDVLVFLDAHCNPEPGAILRLVEDVELLDSRAVVTPAIPTLCQKTWRNLASQTGHGFSFDLETFTCGWLPLDNLRKAERRGRTFHESPALIGCAFALPREVYDAVWGFDPAMQLWGVEDLDFSLKCWLLGYPILHDPAAMVGHRFQDAFASYRVSALHVLVNQLRTAYKNLSLSNWPQWLRLCRERSTQWNPDQPEGAFAAGWHLFEVGRESAERERVYLSARRVHDDVWYVDRFGLPWPRLAPRTSPLSLPVILHPFADPSPSPPPQCQISAVQYQCSGVFKNPPNPIYAFLGTTVTFQVVHASAQSPCADANVSWGGSSGASGTGNSISVKFGNLSRTVVDYKTVTATCGNTVTVNVIVYDLIGGITPLDDFQGRSQTQLGLNEDVDLNYNTEPAGLTSAHIGRLKWFIEAGGVGAISNATESGTGDYNAGAKAGRVILKLQLLDCPSDGLGAAYVRDVIAPNGVNFIQKPGTGVWHVKGVGSVGFYGISYLRPTTVSFMNIQTREGTVAGVGKGYFLFLDGDMHPTGAWFNVGQGNINDGCKELYPADTVTSGAAIPGERGRRSRWPARIPLCARLGYVLR